MARLQHRHRGRISHPLRCVNASGSKGDRDRYTEFGSGALHAHVTRQHDYICQRHLLAARELTVEVALNLFQHGKDLSSRIGIVDGPLILGGQTNARTIGATAHITAAER